MMTKQDTVTMQSVDDVLVAGLRFRGEVGDVIPAMTRMRSSVEAVRTGPFIRLLHEYNPAAGHLLEVCCPVSEAVTADEVKSYVLPGGEMLVSTYRGPLDEVNSGWSAVSAHAREHQMALREGPSRMHYVTIEDESAVEIVLQYPLMLPVWLDKLAAGLDEYTDAATRDHVMAGCGAISPYSTAIEKATWMKGMVDRLDEAVGDAHTRYEIVSGCAHVFPAGRVELARAEYERLEGDIDALLAWMHADPMLFFSRPERDGNRILISKQPYNREAFDAAETDHEQRAAYCHCPMIREAIRQQLPVSGTYCNCGAGWFRPLWEGILGQPVRVEVLGSALMGDDRCSFAIHLPQ